MIPSDAHSKDYYAVMGLKSDASAHDIKMAYRRLARKYHPDLNKESDAEKNFKNLGEAYDVLKDPEKRKLYDNVRAQAQAQPHYRYADGAAGAGHDWSGWQDDEAAAAGFGTDWFESIFGAQRAPRGIDLHGSITVSLKEAYSGVEKEITLPANEQITHPQTIKVKIPAGIKAEQQMRLAGKGVPGAQGANGDLYLTIKIARDPVFDLVGNDVYLTLPITPWEAALGATIKIPTLAGKVDLKIPPHSQGGQTLRLKKRGFSGKEPGDQLVLLKIVIPQPTTQEATKLYETMAKEMAFNPRKHLENYHG